MQLLPHRLERELVKWLDNVGGRTPVQERIARLLEGHRAHDCGAVERVDARARMNLCPLGSGAIAGATLALDRNIAAQALAFEAPTPNSIDATSDRDFMLDFAVDDLDVFLSTNDASTAAAFLFEPVVGATLGAAAAVDGYTARIAEICRKHGILLIADEVMSGMGRTGKPVASQHWNLEPDIILVGKGIASGYAPLGAVLIAPRVVDAFEKGSAAFMHGFTYQSHPVATAAGIAVFDYLEAHKLFDRVTPAGQTLKNVLAAVEHHPNVGQVRGLGLLQGIEFVKIRSTREPFTKEAGIAEKIRQAALEKNVLTYPTQGCVDGVRGDHILLAPPFIITPQESQLIADAIQYALNQVFSA